MVRSVRDRLEEVAKDLDMRTVDKRIGVNVLPRLVNERVKAVRYTAMVQPVRAPLPLQKFRQGSVFGGP
jgi:hypothetical protein